MAAADPGALLERALADATLDISSPHTPHVVVAGKASTAMLAALQRVVDVDRVVLSNGAHPLPDDESVRAGEAALQLAADARRGNRDLIALLSGGASAMLAAPVGGLTLERKRAVTERLLSRGTTIHDLNAVRRHLSRIKGGRLALGVSCVTFALSDVTDDDAATIGSGPAVGDPSMLADAIGVVERAGLAPEMSDVVEAMHAAGETPKPGDPALARSRFVLIGGRRTAMDGVAAAALDAGYGTIVFDEPIVGDAASAGASFARRAMAAARRIGGGPVVIIASGETTVQVRGSGRGGRNQEFAIGAALELANVDVSIQIAACGTDGMDGNSPAAGAVVGPDTVRRAKAAGFDPRAVLAANDSYALFSALGDAVETGPTGTNVSDLFVAVIGN